MPSWMRTSILFRARVVREPDESKGMQNTTRPAKDCYTEEEAAEAIGISIARLHLLLDEHIFNDGSERPEQLTFTTSDITLLSFWHRGTPNPKVVRMPKRY